MSTQRGTAPGLMVADDTERLRVLRRKYTTRLTGE